MAEQVGLLARAKNNDDENWPTAEEVQRLDRSRLCVYWWQLVGGVALGVFLGLYSDFASKEIFNDSTERGSLLATEAFVAYSLCSFVSAPIFGVLSDRSFGRRPLFLFSTLSLGMIGMVLALVPTVASFLTCITLLGCVNGTFALSYAIIVDFTLMAPPGLAGGANDLWHSQLLFWCLKKPRAAGSDQSLVDDLSTHFYVLWTHTLAGYSAGVFTASVWESLWGLKWAMSVCGFACFPGFLVLCFFLEETVPQERLQPISVRETMHGVAQALLSLELMLSSKILAVLALAYAVLMVSNSGIIDVLLFWAEYKFSFFTNSTSHQDCLIGGFLVMAVVLTALAQGLLYPRVGYFKSILIILVWCCVCALALALSTDVTVTMVFALLGAVGYGLGPALMALMTPAVPHLKQGQLQGCINALSAVAYALGPCVFEATFYASVNSNYSDGSRKAREDLLANSFWYLTMGLVFVVFGLVVAAMHHADSAALEPNEQGSQSATSLALQRVDEDHHGA